jgi:hypothetical protein
MVYIPYIPYREKLEELVPNDAGLQWGVSMHRSFLLQFT